MTPKEKAEELIHEYTWRGAFQREHRAKKCSLIAVNILIKTLPSVDSRPPNYQEINEYCCEYWEKVRDELNNDI